MSGSDSCSSLGSSTIRTENIFAAEGRSHRVVDFGNVAQLSQKNKEVLIDAVVHAVNEDYDAMAGDFIRLGFLSPAPRHPIVPAGIHLAGRENGVAVQL